MKYKSKPVPHGTSNGYNNYGCRCDKCREAHRIAYREQVRGVCPSCGGAVSNRYAHELCKPCFHKSIEAAHGTESRYTDGRCRCDLCREAANMARKERRHRNPDAYRAWDREYKRRKRAAAKSEEAAPK